MPVAAAITGAAALGTALLNNYMNKRRYEQQLKDERGNWFMNNEYNSPVAQMQRLKAAGLNPNLVYQNGAAVQPSSQPSTPDYQYEPINGAEVVNSAYQADSTQAAIANTEANTSKTVAETLDLVNNNRIKDTPLGKMSEFSLMSKEQQDYYANLFGVPASQLGVLSIRGMYYLEDLRSRMRNNSNLDQTFRILKHNTNDAENKAALSYLALMVEGFNAATEAHKHGFSGSGDRPDIDWKYNIDDDKVLEMFLRELKEKHWQSSDFKHFLDSFNQTLGNLPNVFKIFKKGDWSKRYEKRTPDSKNSYHFSKHGFN